MAAPLSREAVIHAYHDLLGRPPESEAVISHWISVAKSETDLIDTIVKSEEFSSRLSRGEVNIPAPAPAVAKDALQKELRAELERFLASQENAGPPQVSLSPSGGELGAPRPCGRSERRLHFPQVRAPDISVLIVLYNQAHFTLRCLTSLLAQTDASFEVVLVDNNSSDQTPELLARLDNVQVIVNKTNKGFLRAVNQGAAVARGRTLLLLNNDAFPRAGALATALATLGSNPDIGAVGGRIILPSGVLQEAGSIVWSDGSTAGYARGLPAEAGEAMFRRDVDYCSGAFVLTPKPLFEKLGGLDNAFVPAYYEETDYCLRLWQMGQRVVYEPHAVIDHYEFGSQTAAGSAKALMERNRKILLSRHANVLAGRHLPRTESNVLAARDAVRFRQRLLVIDRQVPLQKLGSGFPRMQALLHEAVAQGWFVSFYPLILPEVNWDEVTAEILPEIEICDRRGVEGLASFLRERRDYYHVVLVSRPENMKPVHDILREQPDIFGGARLIYDAEALYFIREVRRASLEGHIISTADENALITEELQIIEGVDAVVTVAPQEEALFSYRQPVPVYLLGHPVDTIRASPSFETRNGFLFVGRLLEKKTPNYEGLSWFIVSVWPHIRTRLGDIELSVVGMVHPSHDELIAPGVRLLGPVDDLTPLYDRAHVFIAPTRYAAGISIKVLEATAAGLPTLTTPLIAGQLGWVSGREVMSSDNPAIQAKLAVELVSNREHWYAMRDAAQQRLLAEHSAEIFSTELAQLLNVGAAQPANQNWYTEDNPTVSVIVLNLNRADMTIQCVRQLHRHTQGYSFEIVVVDNGSRTEEVAELEAASTRFRLVRLNRNHYFGEANNIGVDAAHGEYVCFLNNDAFVGHNWLPPLMEALQTMPDAGGVGPKFIYPDGRLQEAGALVRADGTANQLGKGGDPGDPEYNKLKIVDYISAATFLMRRSVFQRVLGFDLCWEPAYYEDTDLCFKIRSLKLNIYYVPASSVIHVENATSSDPSHNLQLHNIVDINRGKFLSRWGDYLHDQNRAPRHLFLAREMGQSPAPAVISNRLSIALFTPYGITPGGGERYLFSIAATFSNAYDVTLITPDIISQNRILTVGRELDLDLTGVHLQSLAPNIIYRHGEHLDLTHIRDSKGMVFDIGFVMGNEVLPAIKGPARINVYHCQFPFPVGLEIATAKTRSGAWQSYERILVNSEFTRTHVQRRMEELGLPPKPIEILYPPVPIQRYHEKKAPQILNVGRFFTGQHCKRQDRLIEAFKILAADLPDIQLHLAGSLRSEPEHRDYYMSLIKAAKGLPIHFYPDCSKETLASLYAKCRVYWHATGMNADIIANPEKAEHFGISIVEAMSAGCVPVAFAAGGPKEIISHGNTGFLFQDVKELCALTRPLLQDPNRSIALHMGQAAARSAEKFSSQHFMERVRTLLIKLSEPGTSAASNTAPKTFL
jgi:GT2 family glycosyltransferase